MQVSHLERNKVLRAEPLPTAFCGSAALVNPSIFAFLSHPALDLGASHQPQRGPGIFGPSRHTYLDGEAQVLQALASQVCDTYIVLVPVLYEMSARKMEPRPPPPQQEGHSAYAIRLRTLKFNHSGHEGKKKKWREVAGALNVEGFGNGEPGGLSSLS